MERLIEKQTEGMQKGVSSRDNRDKKTGELRNTG
jgi:hypothetical protein